MEKIKRLARRAKKMKHMVNQAVIVSKRRAPLFKFGAQVPRNETEAKESGIKNGNTKASMNLLII